MKNKKNIELYYDNEQAILLELYLFKPDIFYQDLNNSEKNKSLEAKPSEKDSLRELVITLGESYIEQLRTYYAIRDGKEIEDVDNISFLPNQIVFFEGLIGVGKSFLVNRLSSYMRNRVLRFYLEENISNPIPYDDLIVLADWDRVERRYFGENQPRQLWGELLDQATLDMVAKEQYKLISENLNDETYAPKFVIADRIGGTSRSDSKSMEGRSYGNYKNIELLLEDPRNKVEVIHLVRSPKGFLTLWARTELIEDNEVNEWMSAGDPLNVHKAYEKAVEIFNRYGAHFPYIEEEFPDEFSRMGGGINLLFTLYVYVKSVLEKEYRLKQKEKVFGGAKRKDVIPDHLTNFISGVVWYRDEIYNDMPDLVIRLNNINEIEDKYGDPNTLFWQRDAIKQLEPLFNLVKADDLYKEFYLTLGITGLDAKDFLTYVMYDLSAGVIASLLNSRSGAFHGYDAYKRFSFHSFTNPFHEDFNSISPDNIKHIREFISGYLERLKKKKERKSNP